MVESRSTHADDAWQEFRAALLSLDITSDLVNRNRTEENLAAWLLAKKRYDEVTASPRSEYVVSQPPHPTA
jgi:hypothetical protein